MRVDVKKFLFFGPQVKKQEFLKKAQEIGAIEFIDHSGQKFDIVPEPVKIMNQALKVLKSQPQRPQSTFENIQEALNIASEITSRDEKTNQLREELSFIQQELARVAPFGNFSRSDIEFIQREGQREVQFFFAKDMTKVPERPEILYIGKDHDLHYYIGINQQKQRYENMVEMVINQSYGELIKRRKKVTTELHQHENRLKELGAFKTLIKQAVIQEFNEHALKLNANFVEHHWKECLFSIEGWVAEGDVEEVEKLCDTFSIYVSEISMDEGEVKPTHLENKGSARIGEDLIYIYDTPSVIDKDPSSWVLWAFAFFFAFIIGDGGYGCIFLLLFFVMRWKVKDPSPLGKRFNKLVGILGFSSLVWGLMVSSFFGIDFDLKSPIKRYSPLTKAVEVKLRYHMQQNDETYQEYAEKMPHIKNFKVPYELLTEAKGTKDNKTSYTIYNDFVDSIMLELALFVGVIHLITSMLRNLRRSWAHVGWICFLIGAYLYFPEMLKATSLIHYMFGIPKHFAAAVGPYILMGGVAFAVVVALIQNKLAGAEEIMKVVQVFADVLSYLRLYALALAGAIVASTFNGFATRMNIVFGVIVIILGHILNITLCIMGGVIHGLRLNFIEWYHYSFEGGGKKFSPLSLLKLFK